ncbi:MAG: hypothetical protein J4F39_02395 [Candidatus Latescibacteria bacterium]|nr:hypothetical protein [Candidatus Latescibacterota bacterium]
MDYRTYTILRFRARQAAGKVRRLFLVHFRKSYVAEQATLLEGECNRCGNCCEILFKCPFLVKQDDGFSVCSIYENRPLQCNAFPIDERCLADVKFDCTFSFGKTPAPEQDRSNSLIQIESD